jgi:hypothetical protein
MEPHDPVRSTYLGGVGVIKRRNMWMQILLCIVTLGIYAIYWYYVTAKEMADYKRVDGLPGLRTLLLFVPVANLYSYWKHSELVDSLSESQYNKILVFVLWVFFSPAVWVITQVELNKRATQDA